MSKRKIKTEGQLQKCTGCNNELIINKKNFTYYNRKTHVYIDSKCKMCRLNQINKWNINNIERVKKNYKYWCENNIDKIKEYKKNYGVKNSDYLKNKKSIYYKNNKSKILKKIYEYYKKRIKNDPAFKLRRMISSRVRQILFKNNTSKNGKSILKYLPYTMQELRQHIESQFEPWMNWDNYGIYKIDGERTWNVDHVIPQSLLPYDSMEHPNFKKCWAINNLRPLGAIENIKKGNKL